MPNKPYEEVVMEALFSKHVDSVHDGVNIWIANVLHKEEQMVKAGKMDVKETILYNFAANCTDGEKLLLLVDRLKEDALSNGSKHMRL